MCVVIDGAVRIVVKDNVVEVVRPGGVFGEMALEDQSKRAASAAAATDCNLLSINRNDFIDQDQSCLWHLTAAGAGQPVAQYRTEIAGGTG